jgi:FK506-binding protein 1
VLIKLYLVRFFHLFSSVVFLLFCLYLILTFFEGLDIGVAQLSKNERAIMTIPAHLAYGDKGFPGLIPGKSELIFDIELIEII